MLGIDVGIEQADCDRLVAASAQRGHKMLPHIGFVEGIENATVGENALPHFETRGTRHHRHGLLVFEIVNAGTAVPLKRQDVAKTPGRHKGRGKALALEDGIGCDGRAMRQVLDLGDPDAARGECVESALVGGARDTRHLGDDDSRRSNGHEIGKGPADFNAYTHAASMPQMFGRAAHGCLGRLACWNSKFQSFPSNGSQALRQSARPVDFTPAHGNKLAGSATSLRCENLQPQARSGRGNP